MDLFDRINKLKEEGLNQINQAENQKMLDKINRDILAILNKAYIPTRENNPESVQQERQQKAKVDVNKLQASRMAAAVAAGQAEKSKPAPIKVEKKVGRNDPCPCGSGKKYKHCHGKAM